jgi:hypothetical protein
MNATTTLKCEFCDKCFKRETNYIKHRCEKMKRYDLFKQVVGHLAYLTFNQWRKISGLPPLVVDTFVNSRYFNAFVKFAEFSRKQNIPDKIGYIELMVQKQLLPFNWCDVDVYDYYIEHFDAEVTIDEKVDLSIETLQEIAQKNGCEIKDVFNHISPIQVLRYITSRRLSPWLLLLSKKFMDFMTYKTNREERLLFNSFINVPEWKKIFLANQDKVSEIQGLNKELGI